MDSATLVRTRARRHQERTRATPLRVRMWRERWMYVLLIPGVLYFAVFRYAPLLGNVIAFQDYSPFLGLESPFVGFENFAKLFSDPDLVTAVVNTLVISVLQLLFFFPAPVALALLLNGMILQSAKRFNQSVLDLPH